MNSIKDSKVTVTIKGEPVEVPADAWVGWKNGAVLTWFSCQQQADLALTHHKIDSASPAADLARNQAAHAALKRAGLTNTSDTPALDAADARKAAILATIPEAAHAAVKQEAWYQQGQRGGRYSDHLAEAAANYRDGQAFGSPLAQGL